MKQSGTTPLKQDTSSAYVIVNLGKLADRPEVLNEIGKRLVAYAVKSAVEERLGQKTASPMVVRRLAAGEIIPPDLQSEPGITRVGDKAASGWDKSWLNLIIWDKSWAEDQDRAAIPIAGLHDPAALFRLEAILTPEELAVVQKLNIAS
jgi:hypothetical protein